MWVQSPPEVGYMWVTGGSSQFERGFNVPAAFGDIHTAPHRLANLTAMYSHESGHAELIQQHSQA
jgi:hypothetical protein